MTADESVGHLCCEQTHFLMADEFVWCPYDGQIRCLDWSCSSRPVSRQCFLYSTSLQSMTTADDGDSDDDPDDGVALAIDAGDGGVEVMVG